MGGAARLVREAAHLLLLTSYFLLLTSCQAGQRGGSANQAVARRTSLTSYLVPEDRVIGVLLLTSDF